MPTVALSDDQVPPADSPVTKPQPVVALSDDQVPVAPSTDSTEQPNPFQRFVGRPITQAISGIVGLPNTIGQGVEWLGKNDPTGQIFGYAKGNPALASVGKGIQAITPSASDITNYTAKTGIAPTTAYDPKGLENLYDNVAASIIPVAGQENLAAQTPGMLARMVSSPKVAAAGAGIGQTIAQAIDPQSVPLQITGAMLGGHAPVSAANAAGNAPRIFSGINEKFNPESVASNVLKKAVVSTGETPDIVAGRLTEAPSIAGGPGATPYAPTTGTISNNPGLLALEKGAAIKNPALSAQINQNRLATAQGLQAATAPVGAPSTAFADFAAQREAQRAAADAANVQGAQNALTDAQNAPVRGAGIIKKNAPAAAPAAASQEAIPALSDEQKALANQRNELYGQIPDETPVPNTSGLATAKSIISDMSPLARASGGVHPLVANYIKLYGQDHPDISFGGEPITDPDLISRLSEAAGVEPKPTTLGEARQNQSLVGNAIGETNNNLHRRQLTLLKEGIQNDIDNAGQGGSLAGNEPVPTNPNIPRGNPGRNEGVSMGGKQARPTVEGRIESAQPEELSSQVEGDGKDEFPSGGASPNASRAIEIANQEQSLLDNATANGKYISPKEWRSFVSNKTDTGALEHSVYLHEDSNGNDYYIRSTKNGEYADKSASPADYLRRIDNYNKVAPPNLRMSLVGVSDDPAGGVKIITSQPASLGSKISQTDLDSKLQALGWKKGDGMFSWTHEKTGIGMKDAHNGNIFMKKDGSLDPFDVTFHNIPQGKIGSVFGESEAPTTESSNAAAKLRSANEFNKTQYGPRFGEGPGGVDNVKQAIQGKVLPTAAISKALSTPEGAQQLALAGGSRQEVQDAVKSEFFNRLANKLGANPTSAAVKTFVSQNSDVLQHFPKVQSSLKSYGTSLAKKEGVVSGAENSLQAAQLGQKTNQTDIAEHPIAPFVEGAKSAYLNGKTPEQALSEAFSGAGSPVAKVKMLMQVASKDRSGAALEGLKNAAKNLIGQAHTAGYVGEGNKLDFNQADFATSAAKMGQWLVDGSPKNQALRALFSKQELQPMEMVYRQMLNETRRNKGSLAGSQTAENLAASEAHEKSPAQELTGRAIEGAADHLTHGVFGVTQATAKSVSLLYDKVTASKAKAILNDALSNPELARTLLMRPTPANIPKIQFALKPYIQGVGSSVAVNTHGSPQNQNNQISGQTASSVTAAKLNPAAPTSSASKNAPAGTPLVANGNIPSQEVRRATLAPFEEQSPEVQRQLVAQQQASAPKSHLVAQSVIDHIMREEGPTTIQDGRREYYGFRAGEGTGFDLIQKAVKQYGITSPKTQGIVADLLQGRAQAAGADKFDDPGAQAAVATIAHMRGENGSHAIMAAVAGQPLKKSLSTIPEDAVAKINAMSPQEFQQKLLATRLAYDKQFYGKAQSSVVRNGKTIKGGWWQLFGKGLTDRYNREAADFANLSAQNQPELAAG